MLVAETTERRQQARDLRAQFEGLRLQPRPAPAHFDMAEHDAEMQAETAPEDEGAHWRSCATPIGAAPAPQVEEPRSRAAPAAEGSSPSGIAAPATPPPAGWRMRHAETTTPETQPDQKERSHCDECG